MADRGQRTTLRLGTVEAEVSLIKTSASPRAAQHETRRVAAEAVSGLSPTPDRVEDFGGKATPEQMVAAGAFGPPDEGGAAAELARALPAEFPEATTAAGHLPPDGVRDAFGADEEPDEPARSDAAFPPLQGPVPDALRGQGLADLRAPQPETVVQQGVTTEAGEWVDLTGELKAIDERCILDGMEVAAAVARNAVPSERIRDAHFLAPAGPGAPKVLALLWSALRRTNRAQLVRWTKKTNQALGAIVARGAADGDPHLVLLELEWKANMKAVPRRASLAAALAATGEAELAAAEDYVMALHRNPSVFDDLRDERAGQRADLLEASRVGASWTAPAVDEQAQDAAQGLAAALK